MVKFDILQCIVFEDNTPQKLVEKYLFDTQLLIFLRNAGFYLFFTVLKLYQLTKATAEKVKVALLVQNGLIIYPPLRGEPVSININNVCFFSQRRNQTFIHFTSGKVTVIYSTLDHLQHYLGDFCLQINKGTIITYTNIISYNNEKVEILCKFPHKTMSLEFSKKYAPSVFQTLRKRVPQLEEENVITSPKIEFGNIKEDESTNIGNENNEILEEIRKNPGINATKLYEILPHHQSLRTLRRSLQELVDFEFIEFKGAPKTGGYYYLRKS
jgi:hypothetical protein